MTHLPHLEAELELPLSTHLQDLRKTLIQILWTLGVSTFLALFLFEPVLALLTETLPAPLAFFSPTVGVVLCLRTSFWMGFVLSSPIWGFFLLQFLMPALTATEKKKLLPLLFFSACMLIAGIIFAWKVTLPFANAWLWNFNASMGTNIWGLSTYVDYVLSLIFAHAIVFEAGTVLGLLVHFGIISGKTLQQFRRYFIAGAFVVGALLTPPDVPSQLMVAFPLILFYEGAVLYGKWKGD